MGQAVRDHHGVEGGDAAGLLVDEQVETDNGPIQYVGNEDLHLLAMIVDGHAPGSIYRGLAAQVAQQNSAIVQHQNGAWLGRGGSAVGGGHVADEYEACPHYAQSGRQTEPSLALIEKPCLAARSDADDGCAGALQVGAVVEVRNQDIAGLDGPTKREPGRNESYAVRVHIAVGGHGGDRGGRRWKERALSVQGRW